MKKRLRIFLLFAFAFFAGLAANYVAGIDIRRSARTALNRCREVYRSVLPQAAAKPDRSITAPLGEPFASALESMYSGQPQTGVDGEKHPINVGSGITPDQGMWIYSFCRQVKPRRMLEVGFANGFSTTFILAALKANGAGTHVAIDPFERTHYNGVGLRKVEELGMTANFRFIESPSELALAVLATEGQSYDVIFIDGSHLFDDVMIDFSLADNLCPKGGYILLHDTWMPAIRRVVSFIDLNRADYVRVRETAGNFALYRKQDEDRRDWQQFVEF